jgi:hypothetical protein
MRKPKKIGYDDPTRKRLSEHELFVSFVTAMEQMSAGLELLLTISKSDLVDAQNENKIVASAKFIHSELKKLDAQLIKFAEKINPQELKTIDKLTGLFSGGSGDISLNETTLDKTKKTINRIIEINKKLNHGTNVK